MLHFCGVISTVLTLTIGFYCLSIILNKFGYQFATGQDVQFFFNSGAESAYCMGIIELEKVKAKVLKTECLHRKGLHNVRKMRQVPFNFLGIHFWKDIDPEIAIEQFQTIDDKFSTRDDVINHCNEWASTNISMDKPQWEMRFKEDYTKDTSLLLMKAHHSFTDGVGIVTLFAFLNDESLCPKMMPVNKDFSSIQTFLLVLFTPVALLLQYLVILFHKVHKSTRMIHTPDGKLSSETVLLLTKTFDFEDIRKCYKKYEKTTFNNYLMGVLSKSIHSWFVKNNVEAPDNLLMACPVSMKGFPKSVEEIDMNNYTSNITIQLPILKDMNESLKITKERFAQFFKLYYLFPTVYFQHLFRYIPKKIGTYLYNRFTKEVDIILTNVNGPKEPIYLCNKKIMSITPFLTTFSTIDLIIICFSYNKKIGFQIFADKNIQMDPRELRDLLESNFDGHMA